MGQAMLADLSFRLDPESVRWTYSVKTSVKNTMGGKVVQVFGTTIGPMTVTGSFGKGGPDEQEAFLAKVQGLARRQARGEQAPHTFLFPQRGWDFKVYVMGMSSLEGTMAIAVKPETVNARFNLTLRIVEENAGLKKVAEDQYIQRLTAGIGWEISEFNGPADYAAMTAAMAQPTVSNVQAGTAMGPPTNPATQGGGT